MPEKVIKGFLPKKVDLNMLGLRHRGKNRVAVLSKHGEDLMKPIGARYVLFF